MLVLSDNQPAYRRLYSIETTLFSMINDLLVLMDERKRRVLILYDVSAVFDTVVYSLLLAECRIIGIEGEALNYLRSYLTDSKYCVQIERSLSGMKNLERGVPQGSVLGPVLFCKCIQLNCHVCLRNMEELLNHLLMTSSFTCC